MRMYTRWAERRGFEVEVLDLSEGEEAGIKGAVLEIRGQYAFGFLRPETGVHRLVRISPFDAQARRHTSFASVFVYPVVDDTINIEVREEDIKMDVFRASAPAASTSTRRAARCASRTSPRAWWCRRSRSGRSSRTARPR
jgi:peptide chain release factor 2